MKASNKKGRDAEDQQLAPREFLKRFGNSEFSAMRAWPYFMHLDNSIFVNNAYMCSEVESCSLPSVLQSSCAGLLPFIKGNKSLEEKERKSLTISSLRPSFTYFTVSFGQANASHAYLYSG